MLIGLIADTHGYLDPRVPPALKGVQLILHAGDIGAEGVLVALASIAPVTAVAGNNDANLAQLGLPLRVDMELEGVKLPAPLPLNGLRRQLAGACHALPSNRS